MKKYDVGVEITTESFFDGVSVENKPCAREKVEKMMIDANVINFRVESRHTKRVEVVEAIVSDADWRKGVKTCEDTNE